MSRSKEEFLKSYNDFVTNFEFHLRKYNKKLLNESDNYIVNDIINRFININSGGKYIRAFLIDLGYRMQNNIDNYDINLAIAYETFQTSILIHDDIIDNATLRRGKYTIPYTYQNEFKKYNLKNDSTHNDLGICIGDLGLYFSNKIIIDNYINDKNFPKLFEYYNNIVINTIKGEIIDVYLPFKAKNDKEHITSYDDVAEIMKLKTSRYTIVGPFSLGLILGGSNNKLINSFEKCLEPLGIAFQIKDDILGIISKEETLGKSICSDIEEFKQTILYSYINEYKREYLDELKSFYGKNNITVSEHDKVLDIFEKSGALAYAREKEKEYLDLSKKRLEKIDVSDYYKNVLYGFIEYLETRKK